MLEEFEFMRSNELSLTPKSQLLLYEIGKRRVLVSITSQRKPKITLLGFKRRERQIQMLIYLGSLRGSNYSATKRASREQVDFGFDTGMDFGQELEPPTFWAISWFEDRPIR